MADYARDDFNTLRNTLSKAKDTGTDKFVACCPAHEDKTPSLSVELRDDVLLVHCFAGCDFQSIHEAAGTWRGGKVESWSVRTKNQEAQELTAEQQAAQASLNLRQENREREREVARAAKKAVSEAVLEGQQPPLTSGQFVTSEDELAEVFAIERGKDFAHRHGHGWLRWDSGWTPDQHDYLIGDLMTFGRYRWGRKTEDGMRPDPKSGGSRRVAAGSEVRLRSKLPADDWDTDPLLLGIPGGRVLHLDTGVLRDRVRTDRVTRSAGAAPASIVGHWTSDAWCYFLDTTLPAGVADWLQYVCGYAATGLTDEHLLLFAYGEGGTGKGTFLSAVSNALGEYARRIDPDDLMEGRGEQHPAWLADLQGRRLVVGDEIPRGRRWNTGRANSLVSAEPIRARHMRSSFFEFKPSAQVILAANHAPTVQSKSTGLSRRLVVVPFDKAPETVIKNLLREVNLGVVLSWIAEGARRYFRDGGLPDLPVEIERATARYHDTADPFAPFVETLPVDQWFPRSEVWTRYSTWIADQGIGRPLTRGQVLATLREDYGFEERVSRGQRQVRRVVQVVHPVHQSPVNAYTRACKDKQEIDAPGAPLAPRGGEEEAKLSPDEDERLF